MSGITALGKCHRKSNTTRATVATTSMECLAHVVDGTADQRRAAGDRQTISIPARHPRLDHACALFYWIDHVDRVCSWRMTTMPETTSPLPSRSASPRRRSGPTVTWPMSRIRIGVPGSAGGHDDALEVGDRLRVAAAAHHGTGCRRTRSAGRRSRRCRRAPPRRRAGSRGRNRAAGSGRRSPGSAGRSRRARPPPTLRAPPSGRSAGNQLGTTADPRGCVCRIGPRACTGTPSRARSHRDRARSDYRTAAAQDSREYSMVRVRAQ